MRILCTRSNEHETDHLSDLLVHGFTDLGFEVVDAPKLWYIYNDSKSGPNGEERIKLHGRGFSLSNTIDADTVDRTDIEAKIRCQYFDLVVLTRADFKSVYEDLILEIYPKNKIIIIDGKDQGDLTHYRDHRHLVDAGTYFKRELYFDDPRVHPVSFSFPKQKIIDRTGVVKDTVISGSRPVFKDANGVAQYKFDNEVDYFNDYARSYFGETQMKGGWDCQRHYEIMASGCVPIFHGIEQCPPLICTTLPKEELLAVNGLIAEYGVEWFADAGLAVYKELQASIFDHFVKNCTSESTAKYVLDTHQKNCK